MKHGFSLLNIPEWRRSLYLALFFGGILLVMALNFCVDSMPTSTAAATAADLREFRAACQPNLHDNTTNCTPAVNGHQSIRIGEIVK